MLQFARKTINAFLIMFACIFALCAIVNLFLPHPAGLRWLLDELMYVLIGAICASAMYKSRKSRSAQPYRLTWAKFAIIAPLIAAGWLISYFAEHYAHAGAMGLWSGLDTYYTILFGGALCYFGFVAYRNAQRRS